MGHRGGCWRSCISFLCLWLRRGTDSILSNTKPRSSGRSIILEHARMELKLRKLPPDFCKSMFYWNWQYYSNCNSFEYKRNLENLPIHASGMYKHAESLCISCAAARAVRYPTGSGSSTAGVSSSPYRNAKPLFSAEQWHLPKVVLVLTGDWHGGHWIRWQSSVTITNTRQWRHAVVYKNGESEQSFLWLTITSCYIVKVCLPDPFPVAVNEEVDLSEVVQLVELVEVTVVRPE